MALVALLLVVAFGAFSQTGDSSTSNVDDALSVESSDDVARKYYRAHANVRLGREQRLSNGVAWRLHTDIRTGIAWPRITWMPDRKRMLMANGLFEAMHGDDLYGYDVRDERRRRSDLYNGEVGLREIGPPFFVQVKIAVTYASRQLVSFVDMGYGVQWTSMDLRIIGWVLDLEKGKFWEIEGCDTSDYRRKSFRFGELLNVCDDEAYENFMAIWWDKVQHRLAEAKARGDQVSELCGESMERLTRDSLGMALYLTPEGLAVFYSSWLFPRVMKYCAFHELTVNPIILPYAELEPFMLPGPWRDELLSQSRPVSRR